MAAKVTMQKKLRGDNNDTIIKGRGGQNRPSPFETDQPKPKQHIRVGFAGPRVEYLETVAIKCSNGLGYGWKVWAHLKPNPNRNMHYHNS
jgi:hypothetical protein